MRRDAAGDETSHREKALAALTEELREARARGRTVSFEALALKHGVPEDDVRRCMAAVEALREALAQSGTPPEAEESVPPPPLPEDYEIIEEIGRGGMGVVYRARQKSLDRQVAVKVLRPSEAFFGSTLRRFQKEAKSLGKLRHPHIVSIHDVGEMGGHVFYSMDLIEGESLQSLIHRGEMTAARTVRLLRQVASAIAYTHSHGLIHRDLKPANVLVGGEGAAYVVDFGLARDLDVSGTASAKITRSGHVIGTPAYMSPEQARGDRDRVTEATDIYSLGAILYECLTGRAPFAGSTLADTVFDVIHGDPAPPRKIAPKVPRDLEVICLKAMAKETHRRYSTVLAFLEDLERFEEGRPIRARRPSLVYRARRFGRRHRIPVTTGVIVASILGAIYFAAIHPNMARTPDVLRGFAEDHHIGGRHEAAADTYEMALAKEGPGPDRILILIRLMRCRVEAGDYQEMIGRPDEARALYEKTLVTVKKTCGEFGLLTAQDLLWGAARCHASEGHLDEALKVVEQILAWKALYQKGGGRFLEQWPEPVRAFPTTGDINLFLDRLAPLFGDETGREDLGRILATLLDSTMTSDLTSRWLVEQGEHSATMLVAVLSVLDEYPATAPRGPGGTWRVREWLRWAASRLAGGDLSRELQASLAAVARDASHPPAVRVAALELLCETADLPYWPEQSKSPLRRADELLHLWDEIRTLPRREGLRERVRWGMKYMREAIPEDTFTYLCGYLVDHTGTLPPILGAYNSPRTSPVPLSKKKEAEEFWRAWWRDHGRKDPREWFRVALGLETIPTDSEFREWLQRLAKAYSPWAPRAGWLHHLIWLQRPEGSPGPSWRDARDLKDFPFTWMAALKGVSIRTAPTYLLAGHFALVDGAPSPTLVGGTFGYLSPGTVHRTRTLRLRSRFPGQGIRVRRTLLGVPGLPSPPALRPGFTEAFAARARVLWEEEEAIVKWERKSDSRVLLRDVAGEPVLERCDFPYVPQPRIADLSRFAWPSEGMHTATHFTVTLPQTTYGGFSNWTLGDWRAVLEKGLDRIAGELQEGSAPADRKATPLPHEEEAAHLLRLATFFPLRKAASALARIDSVGTPPGGAHPIPDIVRARLLAGDATVMADPDFHQRYDSGGPEEDLETDYLVRLLLSTRDPEIRAFALDRLRGRRIPEGMAASLEWALEKNNLQAPPWLKDRCAGSGRRLWWASLIPLVPGYLGTGVLMILGGISAAFALWPWRDRAARMRPAAWMVLVGIVAACVSIEVDGGELLPPLWGYALAALGAAVLAFSGRGILRFLPAAALAAAIGATFLPSPNLASMSQRWEAEKLVAYAPNILIVIGICGLLFLSRSLVRLPRGATRPPLSWRQVLFILLYALPVALTHVSWTYRDWRTATRKLGEIHQGMGPTLVVPFAGMEGLSGALASLAVLAGLAMILWDLHHGARRTGGASAPGLP